MQITESIQHQLTKFWLILQSGLCYYYALLNTTYASDSILLKVATYPSWEWIAVIPMRPQKWSSFPVTRKRLCLRHKRTATWQNSKPSKGFNHTSTWCVCAHSNQSLPCYPTQNIHFLPTGPDIIPPPPGLCWTHPRRWKKCHTEMPWGWSARENPGHPIKFVFQINSKQRPVSIAIGLAKKFIQVSKQKTTRMNACIYLCVCVCVCVCIHWKDWCWSWSSNTLATWYEQSIQWNRPWCWERLKAGGEGDDRGWDGWMASPTQWTWVWAGSGSWWWTGRPDGLQFMGSKRVSYDWVTEQQQMYIYLIESFIYTLTHTGTYAHFNYL